MTLIGDIKDFELFGIIDREQKRGTLSIQTRVPIDLLPVMLRGIAGHGAIALLIKASADYILASNNTILSSHE